MQNINESFYFPRHQSTLGKRGWSESHGAKVLQQPYSPPSLPMATARLHYSIKVEEAVLCGKGSVMSIYKDHKRAFLTLSQDSALLTAYRYLDTSDVELQGRVRTEHLHPQQGRERGGEDVTSLPPAPPSS